jgi:hypothetical protein
MARATGIIPLPGALQVPLPAFRGRVCEGAGFFAVSRYSIVPSLLEAVSGL